MVLNFTPGYYHPLTKLLSVLLFCSAIAPNRGEFRACVTTNECPAGAQCFRDDCARCECPAGQSITNHFSGDGNSVQAICLAETHLYMVGERCDSEWRFCPYGSHCDDVSHTCVCNTGLTPNKNGLFCRPALFGESCDRIACDEEIGLQCQGHPALCTCALGYQSMDAWSAFINQRWDHASIGLTPLKCVPRAVGDRCRHDIHCSAVQGSGAACRCHRCLCAVTSHVPNVHGTACGPALGPNDVCEPHVFGVCDGTRGLQCGDNCDVYRRHDVYRQHDFRQTRCRCSDMHDSKNGVCVPKIAGSRCLSDLDCSLLIGGYGICENQTCSIANGTPDYFPRTLLWKCPKGRRTTTSYAPTTTPDVSQSAHSVFSTIVHAAIPLDNSGELKYNTSTATHAMSDSGSSNTSDVYRVTKKDTSDSDSDGLKTSDVHRVTKTTNSTLTPSSNKSTEVSTQDGKTKLHFGTQKMGTEYSGTEHTEAEYSLTAGSSTQRSSITHDNTELMRTYQGSTENSSTKNLGITYTTRDHIEDFTDTGISAGRSDVEKNSSQDVIIRVKIGSGVVEKQASSRHGFQTVAVNVRTTTLTSSANHIATTQTSNQQSPTNKKLATTEPTPRGYTEPTARGYTESYVYTQETQYNSMGGDQFLIVSQSGCSAHRCFIVLCFMCFTLFMDMCLLPGECT